MDELRRLYSEYYHSVADQQWLSRRKHNFIAKPLDELTDEEMMSGVNRTQAEKALEEYVFGGEFKWNEEWKGWFYADTEYPSLILLKSWFEKEN